MLVHVSLDLVSEFIPRVPQFRTEGEDDTIKRICASTSILGAMQAIPQFAYVLRAMKRLKLPIIIHAYYFKCDNVMDNKEVVQYVPDAEMTKETWLLSSPISVHRVDYEILEFAAQDMVDIHGNEHAYIYHMKMKRCKFQSNTENFFRFYDFAQKDADVRELFTKYSYRTMISNVGELMAEKIEKQIASL